MVPYEVGALEQGLYLCQVNLVHSISHLFVLNMLTEYVFYPRHSAQDKYKDVHLRHALLCYKFHGLVREGNKQRNTCYTGKCYNRYSIGCCADE